MMTKAERKIYMREWRRKNKPHTKAYCRKYYLKNKHRLKVKRCTTSDPNPVVQIYLWFKTFQEWIDKPIKRDSFRLSANYREQCRQRAIEYYNSKPNDDDYLIYRRKKDV